MTKISRREFGKLSAAMAAGLAAPALSSGAFAAAQPIRIGGSASLTGALAGTKAMVIGYELWRDDINKAGGLLGRPVELVIYDDQSSPSNVPGIYSKLLDVDKVDLLFSPYGANLTTPLMPMIKQRDRMMIGIHTLGVNTTIKSDKFFVAAPFGPDGPNQWLRSYFDLAKKLGLKTMAFVAADSEFTKTSAAGGKKLCEEYGIKVVSEQFYPPTNSDFSSILQNLKAANAEAVFVASYPRDSVGIIRGISEIGVGDSVQLFGGSMVGPQYGAIMESLGSSLNGIANFQLYVPEPTMKFEGIESFLERYTPRAEAQKVDVIGHYIPPFTYAAGQFYSEAVKATGSLDNAKIASWLHENGASTVVGKAKFDELGDWTERRVLITQFQGIKDKDVAQFRQAGKQVILEPEAYKSGEFIPFAKARG